MVNIPIPLLMGFQSFTVQDFWTRNLDSVSPTLWVPTNILGSPWQEICSFGNDDLRRTELLRNDFHQTSSLGNHVPHMDILGYLGMCEMIRCPNRVLMRIIQRFHQIFCNKTADSWNWFKGKLQETGEDLCVWGKKKWLPAQKFPQKASHWMWTAWISHQSLIACMLGL